MTETTRPRLKVIAPAPVTKFQTSDGKTHDTEIDALAHETFIAVKNDLPEVFDRGRFGSSPASVMYETVKALAMKYEFVPRSAA